MTVKELFNVENFWIDELILEEWLSKLKNYGRKNKYAEDLEDGTEVIVSNDGLEFFKCYYSEYGHCYFDKSNPYKTDSWNYVFEFNKINIE